VNPQMVYDAATGDVLLFGGASGTPSYLEYNDTWEFNGTGWTQLHPTLHPTGGAWEAMAYDPAASAVVLYDSGEVYATGSYLANTWTFSGGQWTESLQGAGPSPRSGENFVYDNVTQDLVMFGGFTCNGSGGCYSHNDTWTFANGGWTNESTGPAPSPRNGASFAFDPDSNVSILFGGRDGGQFFADTWTYDAGSWTSLSSPAAPSPRSGAGLVYDPAADAMLLFGGYTYTLNGSDLFHDDLWSIGLLPAATPQYWSAVNATGGPSARAGVGMVYDPAISGVVLFGGCLSGHYWNASCNATGQTWTYSNGTWSLRNLSTGPSARVNPQMVYDAATGDVLLFGGASGTPSYLEYNDTWEFNGTGWTQLHPTLHPTGGAWEAMAYDPAASEVILFDSGELYATGSDLANTWTFSGGQWNLLVNGTNGSATSPSPRSGETLTYNDATQNLVMFGGFTCDASGDCSNNNDTWLFANGSWHLAPPSSGPSPRNEAASAYDPLLNETVLVGGHSASTFYDDGWGYGGGAWAELTNTSGPSPRSGAGLVYDAAAHAMLLFGGYWGLETAGTSDVFYGGLWIFGPQVPAPTPAIESFAVVPAELTLGHLALLSASVVGDSALTYRYSGLPAGCASADVAALTCSPQAAGNFTLHLTVTSVHGLSASASATLTVVNRTGVIPPGSPLPTNSSGNAFPTLLLIEFAVLGGLATVAAVTGVGLLAHRRDRRLQEQGADLVRAMRLPPREPPGPPPA
jgi:hypothetical protein